MVRNIQNVGVGLQKITVANKQYILRTSGIITYLKRRKSTRFRFNYSRRCDTISSAANDTVTVCCDCRCTELRQQNCRSRSGKSYLSNFYTYPYF